MKTIVDLHNVLHVCFSVARSQAIKQAGVFTEEDIGLFYHKVLDSVISLCSNYGEIIFCNEGRGSLDWRRSIFPEYKKNRKHDDSYHIFIDNLKTTEELISYFPCKIIGVKGAEGDDVMYGLATYFADNDEDVTVITSDRDMVQLLNYSDKIKVFNPIRKEFREKQPNLILEKAIVGDSSDNIPGVPRIGEKTFAKMVLDKNLMTEKTKGFENDISKYVQIIDLSKAPEFIKPEAIVQYNAVEFNEFNPQKIEAFMLDYGMVEHLNRWQSDISNINIAIYENAVREKQQFSVEQTKLTDIEEMLTMINGI